MIFILFGIFGTEPYIRSRTDNPVIFDTAAQISGAVINIVLDPIMICGLFGFPELKAAGAAYATVIGQIASFLVALFFHFKSDKSVDKSLKYIKPQAKLIKEIYAIGLPAIITQALMSFMTYGINIILVKVDETLVTAYGLYYKIQPLILFAAFGLRDTITPIVSFSNGMQNKKRIMGGIKYGVLYTLIIMAIGTVVLEVFADPTLRAFQALWSDRTALYKQGQDLIKYSWLLTEMLLRYKTRTAVKSSTGLFIKQLA